MKIIQNKGTRNKIFYPFGAYILEKKRSKISKQAINE